jgi:hypothetical protein
MIVQDIRMYRSVTSKLAHRIGFCLYFYHMAETDPVSETSSFNEKRDEVNYQKICTSNS